jgi:hypothetical protein
MPLAVALPLMALAFVLGVLFAFGLLLCWSALLAEDDPFGTGAPERGRALEAGRR